MLSRLPGDTCQHHTRNPHAVLTDSCAALPVLFAEDIIPCDIFLSGNFLFGIIFQNILHIIYR